MVTLCSDVTFETSLFDEKTAFCRVLFYTSWGRNDFVSLPFLKLKQTVSTVETISFSCRNKQFLF